MSNRYDKGALNTEKDSAHILRSVLECILRKATKQVAYMTNALVAFCEGMKRVSGSHAVHAQQHRQVCGRATRPLAPLNLPVTTTNTVPPLRVIGAEERAIPFHTALMTLRP